MARALKAIRKRVRPKSPGNPKYESHADLLVLKLKSLYDIEREIQKSMPKLVKASTDEGLREALAHHIEETSEQIERLEEIFGMLEIPAKPERVEAIRGLLEDAQWIIKSVKHPASRDALLIAAAQYVEHYEMAGYGTARTWAERLGRSDIAELLQHSLDEEGEANAQLTKLAESGINERAVSPA